MARLVPHGAQRAGSGQAAQKERLTPRDWKDCCLCQRSVTKRGGRHVGRRGASSRAPTGRPRRPASSSDGAGKGERAASALNVSTSGGRSRGGGAKSALHFLSTVAIRRAPGSRAHPRLGVAGTAAPTRRSRPVAPSTRGDAEALRVSMHHPQRRILWRPCGHDTLLPNVCVNLVSRSWSRYHFCNRNPSNGSVNCRAYWRS